MYGIYAVQHIRGLFLVRQMVQFIIRTFQHLHQERGRARFKPIVIELFVLHRIQQAERIVHPYGISIEMITIVHFF